MEPLITQRPLNARDNGQAAHRSDVPPVTAGSFSVDVTEQSVEVFPAVRRGFAPFHRTASQVLKYPVFVQTLRANAAPTQAKQLS